MRRRLVELTQEFVRCPSVLGREGAMAELVSTEMRRLGFDAVRTDEAGSVVGVVQGRRGGPTLLLDAHLDTVDVEPREAWTHDPFGGAEENGRIFGRGSSDMKGALAAMLLAAADLDREQLAGRVVVSASVEEERVEGAALELVMRREQPDFVIIGEASRLNVVRAGRGRAEFILETEGRPAHTSTPDQGVNAILEMLRAVREVEKLAPHEHPFVGRSALCFTDIISVPYPAHSVVPSRCRATLERRLLPGETPESVEGEILEACRRAELHGVRLKPARAQIETYTGYRFDRPKWMDPWELAEESRLFRAALAAVREIHPESAAGSYQFCTNAAYSAGAAKVPTVGFGPSPESLAHIVDEYVEVEELWKAMLGYRAICLALVEA